MSKVKVDLKSSTKQGNCCLNIVSVLKAAQRNKFFGKNYWNLRKKCHTLKVISQNVFLVCLAKVAINFTQKKNKSLFIFAL